MLSDRVVQWRLLMEEYGPKICHIPGLNNVVADALRRLPTMDKVPYKNNISKDLQKSTHVHKM